MNSKHHDTFNSVGLIHAIELKNRINNRGGKARIANTWLDFGQAWSWQTILVESRIGEFQLLTPRDFKEMNNDSFERYDELIERALK